MFGTEIKLSRMMWFKFEPFTRFHEFDHSMRILNDTIQNQAISGEQNQI